jgi:DNA-binding transcriptional regulator/RsmH inhibitor MraZ
VTWIEAPKTQTEALAVFNDPGQLLLLPWDPDGEQRVVARRRELTEAAAEDPEAIAALQALENRYERIVIDKEFRITCSSEFLQHLGTRRGISSQVYVVRVQDRIEVLSTNFRDQQLKAGHSALDDLP